MLTSALKMDLWSRNIIDSSSCIITLETITKSIMKRDSKSIEADLRAGSFKIVAMLVIKVGLALREHQ